MTKSSRRKYFTPRGKGLQLIRILVLELAIADLQTGTIVELRYLSVNYFNTFMRNKTDRTMLKMVTQLLVPHCGEQMCS